MQEQGPEKSKGFPSIQEWKAKQIKAHDAALERNGGTLPESGSAFSSGFIQTEGINLGDRVTYNVEKVLTLGFQKGRERIQTIRTRLGK